MKKIKCTNLYITALMMVMIIAGVCLYSPKVHAADSLESVTIKVAKKAKKRKLTTYVGNKIQLNVKVGSKTIKPNKATYKTTNKKLAAVNKKGLIVVKKTGTVSIIVTTKDKKNSCIVTLKIKNIPKKPIIAAQSISLNAEKITIKEGESYQLIATVFPEDTTDKSLEWEVTIPSVVSVSPSGLVTGLSRGSTLVCVYNRKNGANVMKICTVSVKGKINLSGTLLLNKNITYTLTGYDDNASLVLTGSGEMDRLLSYPWDAYSYSITSITISYGITTLGDYAFSICRIRDISIPASVTTIHNGAFSTCSNLTSVYIPVSVTQIDINAFAGCDSLRDVYYAGSQEQWNNIDIFDSGNDPLLSATIHTN